MAKALTKAGFVVAAGCVLIAGGVLLALDEVVFQARKRLEDRLWGS